MYVAFSIYFQIELRRLTATLQSFTSVHLETPFAAAQNVLGHRLSVF